jgi:hypothetical protein
VLGQAKGRVNWHYELGDPRNLIEGAREPKDWDALLPGYFLALNGAGNVAVDVTDTKEVVGDVFEPNDGRKLTFMGAFAFALYDWFTCKGEHYPKLHADWYEDIENFHRGNSPHFFYPEED